MRWTSLLFQTQLLPVSGMSQQARRGEKRKLQLKREKEGQRGGGIPHCSGQQACLSTVSLWALHLGSLQYTSFKTTQLGVTQPHGILCIHPVLSPELRFFLSH